MYLNHKLHNSQQFGYKGEEGNRITDRFLGLLLLYPFCGKQGLFHTRALVFCLFVCCCYISGEESWLLLWGKATEMCFFVLQTGGLCQLSRNYEINPLVPVMDSTLRQLQILLFKRGSRGALHKLMESPGGNSTAAPRRSTWAWRAGGRRAQSIRERQSNMSASGSNEESQSIQQVALPQWLQPRLRAQAGAGRGLQGPQPGQVGWVPGQAAQSTY